MRCAILLNKMFQLLLTKSHSLARFQHQTRCAILLNKMFCYAYVRHSLNKMFQLGLMYLSIEYLGLICLIDQVLTTWVLRVLWKHFGPLPQGIIYTLVRATCQAFLLTEVPELEYTIVCWMFDSMETEVFYPGI